MFTSTSGFSILNKNLNNTLSRLSRQSSIKREADYFHENINKVKDVDAFMKDFRLYSYALKSVGLGDAMGQRALIRKVLTSDMSDPNSFANRMRDPRYKELASSFNFGKQKPNMQSGQQEDELIGLYRASFGKEAKEKEKLTEDMEKALGGVKSVNDILDNSKLRNYVMRAFGIDPTNISRDFISKVLTSDPSDPKSFVNQEGNARYKAMAAALGFSADGTLKGGSLSSKTIREVTDNFMIATRGKVIDYVDPSRNDLFYTSYGLAERNRDYFKSHISDVKSIDDLLKDKRLREVVVTAYRLSPDISDAALKKALTDRGYAATLGAVALYDDFKFGTDGKIGKMSAPQTGDQYRSMIEKTKSVVDGALSRLDDIGSVDRLLADKEMMRLLRTAFKIPASMSDADLKSVLTDKSLASKKGLSDLNAAFNFAADGTRQPMTPAQSTVQKNLIRGAIDDARSYFQGQSSKLKSVDDLISNSQMNAYLRMTYGIGADVSDEDLKKALTDADFAAKKGLSALNRDFSFKSDGSVPSMEGAQSPGSTQNTLDRYMKGFKDAQDKGIEEAVKNYKKRTHDKYMKSLKDFLTSNKSDTDRLNNDLPELYQMALRAYGLSESEMSPSQFQKLVTSNPFDAKSYASSLKDPRILKMVKDFNFTEDGKFGLELHALPPATLGKYMADYRSRAMAGLMKDYPGSANAHDAKKTTEALKKTFAKFIADYNKISSLDDLLKTPGVTDFMLKANGLDPSLYNKETLKKIFTSDPKDPRNFLDTGIKRKGDLAKLKSMVEDFNFDKTGNLTREKEGRIESKTAEKRMHEGYLRQKLEEQQGEINDGVRLALYFKRKAPNIMSTYDLLSDRALYKVIETLFNFPPQMAGMDVKRKKELIERRLPIKDLQDPEKLDKLLRRFTANFDAKKREDSPALSLLRSGGRAASGRFR